MNDVPLIATGAFRCSFSFASRPSVKACSDVGSCRTTGLAQRASSASASDGSSTARDDRFVAFGGEAPSE